MTELHANPIEHVIQRNIIKTLALSGSARFSELKPKEIESNLFMYHLNQLKKRDMIKKEGNQYVLTAQAGMYVDRSNIDKLVLRVQPKIITILAVKSAKGNWLLLERTHEPHMNRIGFPSGKVHYGEDIHESAKRELEEKADITGTELQLAGSVIMRFMRDEQVVNHIIGYIFTGTVGDETVIQVDSPYWRAFWGSEDELFGSNTFKGHKDILELLASKSLFMTSLDYESDY